MKKNEEDNDELKILVMRKTHVKNKQNEEDEELKKKFCISFDDDNMECCNRRHFFN